MQLHSNIGDLSLEALILTSARMQALAESDGTSAGVAYATRKQSCRSNLAQGNGGLYRNRAC